MTLKSGNSSTNLANHWLASRCVYLENTINARFGVQCMYGMLGWDDLFIYNGTGYFDRKYVVRPVVEIPLSSVEIGNTGAGETSDPFSLEIH